METKQTLRQWMFENRSRFTNNREMFAAGREEIGAKDRAMRKVYAQYFKNVPGFFSEEIPDEEIVLENVRLAKQTQKLQDKTRIERKAFREYARHENAVSSYNEALLQIFSRYDLSAPPRTKPFSCSRSAGIIHLSDLHFNEKVEIEGNYYDLQVAAIRMRELAEEAKIYFRAKGVRNVLIAMTGDILNGDHYLDKLLTNATNRAQATFVAVDILRQFFLDVSSEFNLSVAAVIGNEPRNTETVAWSSSVASDNYDLTIFNILSHLFVGNPSVQFIRGDCIEQVVNIAGLNILMMHGNSLGGKDIEKEVARAKGRYGDKGTKIDYVIFGHMHSARIGDTYSRSSSLVGANAYSDRGLNLTSKASQNLYIVDGKGGIHGVKVDLQHADCAGYNIEKSLEAYDCKSEEKLHVQETVFRIVI